MRRAEKKSRRGRKYFANRPEDLAACAVAKIGAEFSKRGYPDLTVYNSDGSIYGFIEVKPNDSRGLKKEQQIFAEFCRKYSVPFIRWTPDMGEKTIEEFTQART